MTSTFDPTAELHPEVMESYKRYCDETHAYNGFNADGSHIDCLDCELDDVELEMYHMEKRYEALRKAKTATKAKIRAREAEREAEYEARCIAFETTYQNRVLEREADIWAGFNALFA